MIIFSKNFPRIQLNNRSAQLDCFVVSPKRNCVLVPKGSSTDGVRYVFILISMYSCFIGPTCPAHMSHSIVVAHCFVFFLRQTPQTPRASERIEKLVQLECQGIHSGAISVLMISALCLPPLVHVMCLSRKLFIQKKIIRKPTQKCTFLYFFTCLALCFVLTF